ncbi:MAG: zinc-ribbon domain-containing protein [Pseudomonadota bacterium]
MQAKPGVARQWNVERNGDLKADEVTPGSKKKVWWRCSKGHEWQATIISRSAGASCPYCLGRLAADDNSLGALFPDLAAEWDHEKNPEPGPSRVRPGSLRQVWWLCPEGHSYEARILTRKNGHGCPYCAGQRAGYGRSLADQHPALALEWHPTRNRKLEPSDVTPGSGRKVWWRCARGHVWQASVNSRSHGSGCMRCYMKHGGK